MPTLLYVLVFSVMWVWTYIIPHFDTFFVVCTKDDSQYGYDILCDWGDEKELEGEFTLDYLVHEKAFVIFGIKLIYSIFLEDYRPMEDIAKD